jgi:hypothetical protein
MAFGADGAAQANQWRRCGSNEIARMHWLRAARDQPQRDGSGAVARGQCLHKMESTMAGFSFSAPQVFDVDASGGRKI